MSRKFLKPDRPYPNYGNAFWRNCIYGCAAGWDKGPNSGTATATKENRIGIKGVIDGSINDTYVVRDFGRGLADGGSADPVLWTDPNNRYDIPGNFFSAACLVHINNVVGGIDRAFFLKKAGLAASNPGWWMGQSSTGFYKCEVSDGVGEHAATTGITFANDETHLCVMTYERTRLKMYIDGKLEADVAATRAVGNNTDPIAMFGFATTFIDCDIGMGAVWTRTLSAGDVARLWSDPYQMWKNPMLEEMRQGESVPFSNLDGGGDDCCCETSSPVYGYAPNMVW